MTFGIVSLNEAVSVQLSAVSRAVRAAGLFWIPGPSSLEDKNLGEQPEARPGMTIIFLNGEQQSSVGRRV